MSDEKPNCYRCRHRREVPGSAHSSCHHPDTAPVHEQPEAQLIGLLGRRSGATVIPCTALRTLRITASPIGIDNGWFIWPVNFDPVWLAGCEGYAPFPIAEPAVLP